MATRIMVSCPYRTDNDGRLVKSGLPKKLVNDILQLKENARNLEKPVSALDMFIERIEFMLVRKNDRKWLRTNRNQLLIDVYNLTDLDVFSDDDDAIAKKKLQIGAQLVELIFKY